MASTISSLNIGSGSALGLDSIMENLTKVEDSKVDAYKTRQQSTETKISSYGTLKSSLDSIKTAGEALKSTSLYKNASVAGTAQSLGVQATDRAAAGNYSVEISQLAQAKSASSEAVSDKTSSLGSGSLSLKVGSQEATIDVQDTSLEGMRDAINNAKDQDNKSLGVTATIINDGKGYRLAVSSKETGADNAFEMSATGDDQLSSLVNGMQTKIDAKNAQFSINGVSIEKSSNTVSDAVEGLTIDLAATTTGPETFNVANNDQPAVTAINQFVTAYNQFVTTSNNMTILNRDDASNSGPLMGDSGLRSMQSQLRGALTGSQDKGTLLDMGISFKDNKLVVDNDKLTKALASDDKTAFNVLNGKDGNGGLITDVTSAIDNMTGKQGAYTTAKAALEARSKNQTQQIDAATERRDATLARYKSQFTKLNQFKTQMDSQMESLKQQFESLNASKSS